MKLICFENSGGHKRFQITKESTDNPDLGNQLAPIKLPVIHYIQSLDTAFYEHQGLEGINFYKTKADYDNNNVFFLLDLNVYDNFHTIREVMAGSGLTDVHDPILGMYVSFITDTALLVDQPFSVKIHTDAKVSDHAVVLAQEVAEHIEAAKTLANSNVDNHGTIATHLQGALDKLDHTANGVTVISENHLFQQ